MSARKTVGMLAVGLAAAWAVRGCHRLLAGLTAALCWDPEENEVEFILAMDKLDVPVYKIRGYE